MVFYGILLNYIFLKNKYGSVQGKNLYLFYNDKYFIYLMIVLVNEDVDLDMVVRVGVFVCVGIVGQRCIIIRRLVSDRDIINDGINLITLDVYF